jgi:hypothetical protein
MRKARVHFSFVVDLGLFSGRTIEDIMQQAKNTVASKHKSLIAFDGLDKNFKIELLDPMSFVVIDKDVWDYTHRCDEEKIGGAKK